MRSLRFASALALSVALLGGCRFHVGAVSREDSAAPNPERDAAVGNQIFVDLATRAQRDLSSKPNDLSSPASDLAKPPDLLVVPTPTLSGAKTGGPTSVDLSTEGTSDWIHLGLSSATDINRKATGGSQITVSANATLFQYTTYATTFSWNDGSPTASATNTPNGVYVLGAARGFTISVPAGATVRTLRLYLNVGGTAALTAHLSDGSAPDYTDSQASPNNGAVWLYTLRYSAASAGKTLSITWLLSSGTGASFVAATLQ